MKKLSAGILLYRKEEAGIKVFLGHPGGPYFVRKDEGVWSIPKGEYEESEEPYQAALREFREEIGQDVTGEGIELTPVKRKDGKVIRAWAVEGDADAKRVTSDHFEIEWPPRSGKRQSFPEIDRAGWFSLEEAKRKLGPPQDAFIDELRERLGL